jgi:hypothetical protein
MNITKSSHHISSLVELTQYEAVRRGGNVKRYHTHPYVVVPQTVAHHTFNMLGILLALHPHPSLQLIKAVLWHDVIEGEVGDTPSPTKWENDDLRTALEAAEARCAEKLGLAVAFFPDDDGPHWLRFTDMFEGAMYCHDQRIMGNHGFEQPFALYMSALRKVWLRWPEMPIACIQAVDKTVSEMALLTGRREAW